MVSIQDSKNLLVKWLNKNQATNVQTNLNNNSAMNVNTATLSTPNPQTDLKGWTQNKLQQNGVIQPTIQPSQNPSISNNLPVNMQNNNTGAGNIIQTPSPSRFIGFQNVAPVQNQTLLDKVKDGRYFLIPTESSTVNYNNSQEEERYNQQAKALEDLQHDIYNHKRTLTENEINTYYSELSDNMDAVMQLQKELKPILANGNMVSTEQLEQKYNQLIQPKNLKNAKDIKKKTEEDNKVYQKSKDRIDTVLKGNWKGLSADGLQKVKDMNTLYQATEDAKKIGVVGGATDYEILSYLIKNTPELQKVYKDMESLKFTEEDLAILGNKNVNRVLQGSTAIGNLVRDWTGGNSEDKPTEQELDTVIRGKRALDEEFEKSTLKKISTEIGVSADSLEKFIYRTYKDWQNYGLEKATTAFDLLFPKSYWEDKLGTKLSDSNYMSIMGLFDAMTSSARDEKIQQNKQNVMDYTASVNKEYENRKAANLNPDIENYVNSRSMTDMLLQGDLKPFLYKSSGEAAQNVDNLVTMGLGVVAPEIVLPVMFADSYARESQESFEELMDVQTKMGISQDEAYDNARKGSAYVGLASSLVEVGLEKVLGGVETTASTAFHDLLMKDFTERATKMVAEKGLVDLLKQGAVTQFKASLEEGLEEVFQQAIHNKALQEYDPDQKITEGMLEAFEGGFYNWMNLLAGGGDVMSNIDTESMKQSALQGAYNAGVNTRKVVDTVKDTLKNTKNKITSIGKKTATQNVVENADNKVTTNQTTDNQNTSITPVNNNIAENNNDIIELKDVTDLDENVENEETENQTTELAEGLGDKVWDSLSGIEENTRNRMKKNPYSAQENKALIDTMESDPGIDINDYMLDRYDTVLDSIEENLKKEENRRKDVGKLYQTLEETNAPIDATNLKNKTTDFLQKMEDLGDILSSSDQSKIKTILENIQQIGDGTMDVWKVRKIADQRSKLGEASTDGLRLIREIRDAIDEEIRVQRPEMKEVDQEYRKSLDDIRDLRGNLVNKRTGEFKGNAVNIVKNMLSGSNRAYLEKLEKYIPGIKQRLQAIRDVKFVYNAYETGNGSRFQSGIGKAVFGNIFKFLGATGGIPGVIAGAVADAGVEAGMKSLTRKALRETVLKETERSRAELEKINQKIEEGKQLEAQDKQKLKEIGEKIVKNAEEAQKTKAEQEAWDKYFNDIKNQQALPESIKLTKVTEINKPTTPKKPKNKVTSKKSTTTEQKQTKKNKITEKTVESLADLWGVKTDENGVKTIKLGDKEYQNKKPENVKQRDWIKEQFTNEYIFKPEAGDTPYISNVIKLIKGETDKAKIGKNNNLYQDKLGHIFENHGEFAIENLIATVNYPDNIVEHPYQQENIKYNLKKIPGTNDFFKAVIEIKDGEETLSFFQRVSSSEESYLNEQKKSDLPASENPINTYRKRSRGQVQPTSLSEDNITKISEKASENKSEEKKNIVTKNSKVTEKKVEVRETPKTEVKQEENQTKKFDYGTYGEVMNKLDAKEKEIKAKLDKQYEEERATMMKRFEELRDKENKTETEGKELVKLADQLNNQSNKYERLLDEEMKKQAPELLKEKEELQQAFDRDWKAMWDKRVAEINKPFKELRDKYMKKILAELGLNEDVELTKEVYDQLVIADETRAKIKKLEDERRAEYDKLQNGEQTVTKPKKNVLAKNDKVTAPVTEVKVTKGEDIIPDNSSITGRFRNLTLEEYQAMQEVEGLEEVYLKEDPDTVDKLTYFKDAMNYINTMDYGLSDEFELDYKSYPVRSMAENIVYLQQLKERIENNEATEEDRQRSDYYLGKDKKNKGNEWDIEGLEREQKSDIGSILEYVGFENIDKGLIDDYYNNFVNLIGHETQFDRKDNQEKRDNFKKVYDKYGKYWKQGDSDYQRDSFVNRATDIDNLDNNETAQIPTIFEEDLQESNLKNLDENETAQTTEEEMNKVTAKKTESKPKNLVTSKTAENTNTEVETAPATTDIDSQSNEIWQDSIDNLKKGKYESRGALGKMKTYRKQNADGSTISYFEGNGLGGETKYNFIVIYSPEGGQHNYTVEKKGDQPATVIERGRQLTDEEITKLNNILKGKKGEVEVKDTKIDMDNVEDKKDPINAFLDNNEEVKKNPNKKYDYLSKLNEETNWTDYDTDIKYHGTVAEKVQQIIDSFGKLPNGVQMPIKFDKSNYGNWIRVGDYETGINSRNMESDIEFEYAKFLYDNPEIRSTKEIKADGLKEAIKKGNEIHKEVVKDTEEQANGIPLEPDKFIWQQPTAEQGIDAIYQEIKKLSDYYEALKATDYKVLTAAEAKEWKNAEGKSYYDIRNDSYGIYGKKLKFKSDRSQAFKNLVQNIKDANGNEKQLGAIANSLYIQRVKEDFKKNYNYPSEITDKIPGLRTAKDDYERYLKGRDTSFSGKDPRIDYADKDVIGAGIKRQDGNQITATQRREIVNGVLEYAKVLGIDMKKMSEDAGVTYVHLNGKHPFLTSHAVGLFHGYFKSISVGADMESYREKGEGRDAKLETHTVPVVMAHEITHAIDSMFERQLFSDQKTREMGRKMNDARKLGAYRHSREEITARMVEEYVDVMKGGEGYYDMRGYWNKEIFDNEIKPYVEQVFKEKFEGYRLTDKEREAIKLYEAPKSNNSVTATSKNKVTSK